MTEENDEVFAASIETVRGSLNNQAGASWYRFLKNLRTLVTWCQPTLLASVRWAGKESLTHLEDDVGAQSVAV